MTVPLAVVPLPLGGRHFRNGAAKPCPMPAAMRPRMFTIVSLKPRAQCDMIRRVMPQECFLRQNRNLVPGGGFPHGMVRSVQA